MFKNAPRFAENILVKHRIFALTTVTGGNYAPVTQIRKIQFPFWKISAIDRTRKTKQNKKIK